MSEISKRQIRLALVLAVYWIAAMAVCHFVHRALGEQRWLGWPPNPPFLLYALVLFTPVAALLVWRPVFVLMESWPAAHRVVLLAFLATVFLGHTVNASRYTFPFMDWQMFTRPFKPESISHYEFTGVCEDRSEVALNPVRLFPSLDHLRFYLGFRRLSEILSQPEHVDSPLWEVYDDVLLAIAHRHNLKHPEQRVIAVRVDRIELPPAGAADPREQVTQFRVVLVAPEPTL